MKAARKKYQNILLVIGIFIVAFALSFVAMYFYDERSKTNTLLGAEFMYNGYIETIDGVYIGGIYEDSFEGSGQFNFITGEIYSGKWSESNMSGSGKMIFEGIGIYEGAYSFSKREGDGTFLWDNGDEYVGEWSEDKINGKGKYTFANGNYITGVFRNNKIHSGVYGVSGDDYSCEISIENGRLSESIKLSLSSGESYEGEMRGGKFDGYGTLKYSDGSIYTGNFKDNKRSGEGTYTWKSGECYDGAWENDKMSGRGIYYYTAKRAAPKLEGTFLNGVPSGECKYYETAYITYTTTWENGKCVKVAEG